jgi:hypothetical protein
LAKEHKPNGSYDMIISRRATKSGLSIPQAVGLCGGGLDLGIYSLQSPRFNTTTSFDEKSMI